MPYVGGQTVKVSFYRDGSKVEVKTVSVLAVGNGAGQFHLGFSSEQRRGSCRRAPRTTRRPQQGAFSGRSQERARRPPEPRPGRAGVHRCACCSPS